MNDVYNNIFDDKNNINRNIKYYKNYLQHDSETKILNFNFNGVGIYICDRLIGSFFIAIKLDGIQMDARYNEKNILEMLS